MRKFEPSTQGRENFHRFPPSVGLFFGQTCRVFLLFSPTVSVIRVVHPVVFYIRPRSTFPPITWSMWWKWKVKVTVNHGALQLTDGTPPGGMIFCDAAFPPEQYDEKFSVERNLSQMGVINRGGGERDFKIFYTHWLELESRDETGGVFVASGTTSKEFRFDCCKFLNTLDPKKRLFFSNLFFVEIEKFFYSSIHDQRNLSRSTTATNQK